MQNRTSDQHKGGQAKGEREAEARTRARHGESDRRDARNVAERAERAKLQKPEQDG